MCRKKSHPHSPKGSRNGQALPFPLLFVDFSTIHLENLFESRNILYCSMYIFSCICKSQVSSWSGTYQGIMHHYSTGCRDTKLLKASCKTYRYFLPMRFYFVGPSIKYLYFHPNSFKFILVSLQCPSTAKSLGICVIYSDLSGTISKLAFYLE